MERPRAVSFLVALRPRQWAKNVFVFAALVFAGQLVFQRENLFTRSLHHETAYSIQRRLQFRGVQVIILPIRVWERTRAA